MTPETILKKCPVCQGENLVWGVVPAVSTAFYFRPRGASLGQQVKDLLRASSLLAWRKGVDTCLCQDCGYLMHFAVLPKK